MIEEYPKWVGTDPTDVNIGKIVANADEENALIATPKKAKKVAEPSADSLV